MKESDIPSAKILDCYIELTAEDAATLFGNVKREDVFGKELPEYSISIGNPARPIASREK